MLKLNWIGYYMQYDGYGRFNSRMVGALGGLGIQVKAATLDHPAMPAWMQKQEGIDWRNLTISCVPPYMVQQVPGRHWLFTMTEGSVAPPKWVEAIAASGVERLLVPCQHNLEAFQSSGVDIPISVIPGGTDPSEFPLLFPKAFRYDDMRRRPYTFLTITDRGDRKGWLEVWDAFYKLNAFGGKTTGEQNVRLIIKSRPKEKSASVTDWMADAKGVDKRLFYQTVDAADMNAIFSQADCVVLPSRCEGWGMPHREAAAMGLPVIVQPYAGLDDGFTDEWSICVRNGRIAPIPKENKVSLGEWKVADVDELAATMRWCFDNPNQALARGRRASRWIAANQTWEHSATALAKLIVGEKHAVYMECPPISLARSA